MINDLKRKIIELKKNRVLAVRNKEKIIQIAKKLFLDYQKGKITEEEYKEELKKSFGGKEVKEWIEYYDVYIEQCTGQIEFYGYKLMQEKTRALTKKFVSFVLILVLFLILFFVYLQLQKQVFFAPITETYVDNLNLFYNESAEYVWKPENEGRINGVKLSGLIEGDGEVKVYFEDKLILDSKNLEITEGKIISGNTVYNNLDNTSENNNFSSDNIYGGDVNFSGSSENFVSNQAQVENTIKKFSEICEETCDLSEFNFSSGNYKLRIEINGNAKVRIDNLSYGIFTKVRIDNLSYGIFKEVAKAEVKETAQREEKTAKGKKVNFDGLIQGDLISTEIPESWNVKDKSKLKVYWKEGGEEIDFDAVDNNNDGIIDELSWESSQGGTQTFEIIVITKAEHLDSNKEFISDIYDSVKELDGIWSEEIPDKHYIRVKFERKLTNTNDITIYPRKISGNPRIEIYEINGTSTIASFDTLKDNEYNKVYLTSLQNSQDSFDLLVLDGAIEIEHIVDPSASPGNGVDLRAQACARQNQQGSQNTFDLACFGTYPNSTCSSSGDRLSCDDGIVETATTFTGTYGGINASFYNSSITNCVQIVQVFLCYNFWGSAPNQHSCEVGVDSDGGASWSSFSVSCFGGDSGISCTNFTAGQNWQCSNFFGANGTSALAKAQAFKQGGGGIRSWNFDVLFFNLTYTADTTPPQVTIIDPQNNFYNTSFIYFNISTNENSTANYSLDGGRTNISMSANASLTGFTAFNNSIADGIYTVNYYVRDIYGNSNNTENVTFTVDTTAPTANYVSPTENSGVARNRDYIEVNVTASDSGVGLDSILIRLYNSSQNQINSSTTSSPNYINFSGLSDGLYFYNTTANDTLNNKVDLTTRNITLDRTFPLISYGVGTENDNAVVNRDWIYVNVTFLEINFANITFLLVNDFGIVNSTTHTTEIYEINWTNLPAGNYTYNVSIYDLAGNFNSTATRKINLSASAGNSAPEIIFVGLVNDSFTPLGSATPLESNARNVSFVFTAYDGNGAGNLNGSTAQARFQRTGQITRENLTCSEISGQNTTSTKNYSCTIGMWYFDQSGNWIVNATIKDNSNAMAENSSAQFFYATLGTFAFSPKSFGFGILLPGEINKLALEAMLINNTGNANSSSLNITAINLLGEQDSNYMIPAENFTVHISAFCDVGTRMQNGTNVSVIGSLLPPGNNSLNYRNETSGQEELYFCIEEVPNSIISQDYSTRIGGSWEIFIFVAPFVIRRKRKKHGKEINEKIEVDKEELLDLLGDKLEELLILVKERKIKREEKEIIKKEKMEKKEIEVPLGVFREKAGAAEVLCKYLRENTGLKFVEIAELLNRDRRTIGANYKNAVRRIKNKIKIDKTGEEIYIPIEILANRKLSILESVVHYLREKGLRNSEIAGMLNRDPRNVWTLYSRAVKKLRKSNI
ncbi:hypothetical protein HYV50_00605 [Candidatus Pacearchaeota archaeon]|nr:hypothetical protein [Candidatus Pacearchaeota archaeon]